MLEKENSDFKEGLKTTSLFGGVQIFKILLSIINTKLVAVLLGPLGIGIQGLLSSTIGIISNISGLGLGTSAVRDVSSAYYSGDIDRFSKTVTVFRRLVWYTGGLGLIICLFGAPLWSKITFGSYEYTVSFSILAITILLGQISTGQGVVLQGARKFRQMAKSGIIGSVLGLFTGIPFYYLFGVKGIVPSMLLSSITGICLTFYYSRKVKVKKQNLLIKEVFNHGNLMLKMGFFVALQSFLSIFCAYAVRIFISHTGSIVDVGLYNSGFNIINTYIGMIFAAMGTDYYPRLSSYASDNDKFKNCINQQMELALLLLSPMIIVFLLLGNYAITLLYSEKFVGATLMIMLGIIGVFFKAPSWCLGFTFLAKGDTRAFFVNELISEFYILMLNLLFYYLWGLNGLGGSFLLSYIIYFVQCYFICKVRYHISIDVSVFQILIPQLLLSLAMFYVVVYSSSNLKYIFFAPFLLLVSFILAYKNLSKKINIKKYLCKK